MATGEKCFSYKLFILVVSLFSLFNFLVFANQAEAQGAGISIKPATIDEKLEPGEIKEFKLTIENLSATDQEYFVFPRNISGVKDGGTPIFAKDSNEKTGYEISDWVTLPFEKIYVPANQSISFEVIINVPGNASPGSHFGGVFISAEPPEIQNSGASVGYQVGNLIHVRVAGDVIESGSIRQFSTSKPFYSSQNVDFNVRIENSGNVLIRPVGPLEVFNMLGNKVGTVVFNEDGANVFPNSTREFLDLKWSGTSVGFGRYEAILSPVYGDEGAKKTMSSTVTFWILPMNIILPALGVLGTLLLIVFISVKIYVRRSLQHLQHERRLVRRRKTRGSSGLLLVTVVMLTVTALFLIVLLALFA